MNREEYRKHKTQKPKVVMDAFEKWKSVNYLTCKCVIHHRDDTEETRKYNSEHYERWGCDEDGTFEYGKYVIFMTLSEHSVYHNTGKERSEETRAKISLNHADFSGKENPMYGKVHSEETRAKMSVAHKGKKFSEEHRSKLSATKKSTCTLYTMYKNNGGTLNWNGFQKALKNGEIILDDLN